jgi:hypothetical protein
MPPRSYGEKRLGPYSITASGVSGSWDARDYTIVGVQVSISGADQADGKLYLQSSINGNDYDDYDWEYEIPIGNSSHTWHVGVFCGRFVRIRIDAGTLTAGAVSIHCSGRVQG